MKPLSIREAADKLGMTTSGVRYQIINGKLRGRQTAKGWRVYLPDDTPGPSHNGNAEEADPLLSIADELIALGRRLRSAVKEHDDRVKRMAIEELGSSLVEHAQKGR